MDFYDTRMIFGGAFSKKAAKMNYTHNTPIFHQLMTTIQVPFEGLCRPDRIVKTHHEYPCDRHRPYYGHLVRWLHSLLVSPSIVTMDGEIIEMDSNVTMTHIHTNLLVPWMNQTRNRTMDIYVDDRHYRIEYVHDDYVVRIKAFRRETAV